MSRGGSFVCLQCKINFAACCRITHFLDFSSVHSLNYFYLIFVGTSGYMILQRACDVPNLLCYKKEFDSYGTNTPIRRLENKGTTLDFPVGKSQKMRERCRVSKYSERVFRTVEHHFFFLK